MTDQPREPAAERVVASEVVFRGKKVTVRVDKVELDGNRTSTREIIEHPGVAAIVPIDGDGNVLFVRQFRLATGAIMLEIPAGVLDPGEDAETGAQRELREETGMQAERLTPLAGEIYVSPGVSTEWIRIFLAQGLSEAPLDADEDEDIAVERIPLAEAVAMVVRGEFRDSKSVAGVLLADRFLNP